MGHIIEGIVTAVCISREKGTVKHDVGKAKVIDGYGLENDAHGGPWHRQISLLSEGSIQKMVDIGLDAFPGIFAENITVRGIDLPKLPIGVWLRIGEKVILEVTQIGKECHSGCAILKQVGKCIMPKEGIFTKVIRGGEVKQGDIIRVGFPVRCGILVISDRGYSGERVDTSGDVIEDAIKSIGRVTDRELIPDDYDKIVNELKRMADIVDVDLILTTGGTGLGPRDVTPEATIEVSEKLVPGIPHAMLQSGLGKTPHAMLSRATAGLRGGTLIINLPGNPKAVKEGLDSILHALPHAVEIIRGWEYQ
ncbi:MAG: molybdenum cofactor biosynthesis protein [Firmicutes bacterium]|nr:molybdenum cofactor biosynthesis protein [Bacillota bacterium]